MSSAPARSRQPLSTPVSGGVGESVLRPDGTLKVKGEFAYSSDLWMDGMLWGATLRSPHPRARIRGLDIGSALAVPGVHAVLTYDDVPGHKVYGLEHADQPVLAEGDVRFHGEPIAIVAANHPEIARRAASAIAVDFEVLEPIVDPEVALRADAPRVLDDHPDGNVVRHVVIRHGDQSKVSAEAAEVVVTGTYEVGMQDQAFLGPESGLAVPALDGGVDLYVATQWLHVDRSQVASCLGLPEELVRITLAGVGGAFGAREDLSMQIHASMLALHTGKPIKMVYSREESFFGHVHRHPARLTYEHGATRDGRLVYVKARTVLDGGAYASSTQAVVTNAATLGVGPYNVPNAHMECFGVYTNNPPCGAMRGFGAVQAAFAYESQMDKLAEAVGIDPVTVRMVNAISRATRCRPVRSSTQPRRWPRCCSGSPTCPCPRRAAMTTSTSGRCRAGCPTPRTVRGLCAGSATASASRTSASPQVSTTSPRPACGSRSSVVSRLRASIQRQRRWARGW